MPSNPIGARVERALSYNPLEHSDKENKAELENLHQLINKAPLAKRKDLKARIEFLDTYQRLRAKTVSGIARMVLFPAEESVVATSDAAKQMEAFLKPFKEAFENGDYNEDPTSFDAFMDKISQILAKHTKKALPEDFIRSVFQVLNRAVIHLKEGNPEMLSKLEDFRSWFKAFSLAIKRGGKLPPRLPARDGGRVGETEADPSERTPKKVPGDLSKGQAPGVPFLDVVKTLPLDGPLSDLFNQIRQRLNAGETSETVADILQLLSQPQNMELLLSHKEQRNQLLPQLSNMVKIVSLSSTPAMQKQLGDKLEKFLATMHQKLGFRATVEKDLGSFEVVKDLLRDQKEVAKKLRSAASFFQVGHPKYAIMLIVHRLKRLLNISGGAAAAQEISLTDYFKGVCSKQVIEPLYNSLKEHLGDISEEEFMQLVYTAFEATDSEVARIVEFNQKVKQQLEKLPNSDLSNELSNLVAKNLAPEQTIDKMLVILTSSMKQLIQDPHAKATIPLVQAAIKIAENSLSKQALQEKQVQLSALVERALSMNKLRSIVEVNELSNVWETINTIRRHINDLFNGQKSLIEIFPRVMQIFTQIFSGEFGPLTPEELDYTVKLFRKLGSQLKSDLSKATRTSSSRAEKATLKAQEKAATDLERRLNKMATLYKKFEPTRVDMSPQKHAEQVVKEAAKVLNKQSTSSERKAMIAAYAVNYLEVKYPSSKGGGIGALVDARPTLVDSQIELLREYLPGDGSGGESKGSS